MNELMFTGLQVVGSSVMCLAAGIGIGAVGLRLVDRAKLPDCAGCEAGVEVECPYRGEPYGCNNRELRVKVLGW